MIGHTPGPWRWLDDHTLLGDHGRRPVVLRSPGTLQERSPETGLLVPFDPSGPNGKLLAAAADMASAILVALDCPYFEANPTCPEVIALEKALRSAGVDF